MTKLSLLILQPEHSLCPLHFSASELPPTNESASNPNRRRYGEWKGILSYRAQRFGEAQPSPILSSYPVASPPHRVTRPHQHSQCYDFLTTLEHRQGILDRDLAYGWGLAVGNRVLFGEEGRPDSDFFLLFFYDRLP
jgi:hypothetical protein